MLGKRIVFIEMLGIRPPNGEASLCENEHWATSNKTQKAERQDSSKSELSAAVNR